MSIRDSFNRHLGRKTSDEQFEDYRNRYNEGRTAAGLEPFARGGSQGRDIGGFGGSPPPPTGSVPIHPVAGVPQGAMQEAFAGTPRSTMTNNLGPAALQEVGPMFMQNRYGPGQLNHYGANLGGPGMGPGGAPTGFGGSIGMMAPQMMSGGRVDSPFPGQGGGQGGMTGLEQAQILAALIGAGGNLYGAYKQGKAKDREFDMMERREEDEDEQRRKKGQAFGEAFRRYAGR